MKHAPFRRLRWVALLLSLGGPRLAQAQPDSPADLLAARMAEDRLPSLSVAVAHAGELSWVGALGLADVENAVPASPRTVYRIGSVSKTLTAAVVLRLAEQGRLELDGPVQTHCPSFPDKGVRVTPRQLLGHLGGVRHYDWSRFAEEFLSDTPYESVEASLAVFRDDPLAAAPGAGMIYSSYGYNLLGCVVEGASGKPYGAALAEEVLEPAGMRHTRLDTARDLVPHRARWYSWAGDGEWRHSPFVDLSDRYPSGGLLSTPSDLAAFGLALLDERLLGKPSLEAMSAPGVTGAGEPTAYGLGWRLTDRPGELYHGGTSVGASAYLYLRLDTGTVVAFATNVDRWEEPRHDLAVALADWVEGR